MLKELWAEGYSGSQIAGMLGGITRNAVIGKVHRLGLLGRGPSGKQRSQKWKADAPARKLKPIIRYRELSKPLPFFSLDEAILPSRELRLLELGAGQCRFPTTTDWPKGKDHRFCGNPTKPGESWCAGHRARVYLPKSSLRDREHERRAA